MNMITEQQQIAYEHKDLLKRLKTVIGHFTIPQDVNELKTQHEMVTELFNNIQKIGGDNRRRHRGSREQQLPDGCILRQRLQLPNKQGVHELFLIKRGIHLVDTETGRSYTSLHKANEEHYISSNKVWTEEDEAKNPKHKAGQARNAVSAWGNGSNTQGFYALRINTEDQYDLPIIDINDEDWLRENHLNFALQN